MILLEIRQSDTAALFPLVAAKIQEQISQTADKEYIVIALPGGRSVLKLLHALLPMLRNIPPEVRKKLRFFMIDERLVDLSSSDSNFRMLQAEFFQAAIEEGLLEASQLHPFVIGSSSVDGEPLSKLLGSYSEELKRFGGVFDVAVVGVGEDAHIAALFPNHPSIEDPSDGFIAFDSSPKPPSGRMSASASLILKSGLLVVLFIGEGKREAYQRFKRGEPASSCPATLAMKASYSIIASDIT
jgi:6-phosphogluconolactonase